MKLVLDTSVIVAAVRSGAGASRRLLIAALERRFEMLLSVALALEYEAVLKRPEQLEACQSTVQQIDKLMSAMIAVARPVHRQFFWRPLLPDANDEMVLEVALSSNADLLVTFNRKDFLGIGATRGIAVVTPQEALQHMRRNDENQ